MTAPAPAVIEERRLAALTDALRLALRALNAAPRFRVDGTDSYRIASRISAVIKDSGSIAPHPVLAALESARRAIEEATDIMHYEDGLPVTALDGADIERIHGSLCSVLVEIEEATVSLAPGG